MLMTIASRTLAVALGGAALLGLVVVHAQSGRVPDLRKDLDKQDAIYRSRGHSVPRGYVTDRSLVHYDELLPRDFAATRDALGTRGRWLDIGAGSGQAMLDFAERMRNEPLGGDGAEDALDVRGRLVAMSIEDRRRDAWHQVASTLRANEMRYIHGKRLRDFPPDELGRFDMITDVYGGFSYTEDLSTFMDKVLALLHTGGRFFTLIQAVHLADGKERPQTWFLTEIGDPAGRDVTPCAWLKRIACVQVACESKSTWDPATELIEVRKLCEATSVPKLVPISYEAGTPPGRKFMLVSP